MGVLIRASLTSALALVSACSRSPASPASDAGSAAALAPTVSSVAPATPALAHPSPSASASQDLARELAALAGAALPPSPRASARRGDPSSGGVAPAPGEVVGFSGNALPGMTPRSKLMPLAKPGARCAPCFFNGRCVLLTEGDPSVPCCDYAGGTKADAWTPGVAGGLGHAAECLTLILNAPTSPPSPPPARGKLLPLAKPDQPCRECFFNGRCELLVDGRASAELPCCDYAHGKQAGAWGDDRDAASCLATEARGR